mgnify:FL=1
MVKRLATYARTSAELLIKLLKGETPEKWPVRLTYYNYNINIMG